MNTYWVLAFAAISILVLISLVLSLYIFHFFRKLSRGVGRSDLIKILSRLSEIEKENSDNIKGIEREIEEIRKDATNHLQKASVVRFNPFSEMGGDHSFSVALLDAHLTGFVITGLHTRERTRIYIKKIDKGKCRQNLSKEEKEALAKASV